MEIVMDSGNSERINACNHNGVRPLCRCCGGGNKRKGKTCAKAASRYQSNKARRSKPKSKDHRH